MDEIRIIELTRDEARRHVPLLARLSENGQTDAHEEMWWDLSSDAGYVASGVHEPRMGTMRLFAAYAGGELVGALATAVDSSEEGLPPDTVILSRMATTGQIRGAGKLLLRECCRCAVERGQGVVAFALPTARGFYRSQGMTVTAHRRLYRCEFTAAQAAAYSAA